MWEGGVGWLEGRGERGPSEWGVTGGEGEWGCRVVEGGSSGR